MAATEDPATAAVVLNWNAPALTCACLDGLLRQAPVPWLIVCDNGSDDDSISVIRAFLERHGLRVHDTAEVAAACAGDPFAVLLPLGNNRGFAGGINPGIALALRLGAEFVWLLNNDARPDDAALAALSAHARARRADGLIGATVVDAAAPERIEAAGGCRYGPLTTVRTPAHGGRRISELPRLAAARMDYVYGASIFARAEVFRTVGLLDEAFFLYCEELDLCRRAQRAGWALGWCRDARVAHHGGASSARHGSAFVQYHENRSTLLFTRRHHPLLFLPAALFRLAAKHLVLPLRGQARLLPAVWRAYADLFRARGRG